MKEIESESPTLITKIERVKAIDSYIFVAGNIGNKNGERINIVLTYDETIHFIKDLQNAVGNVFLQGDSNGIY